MYPDTLFLNSSRPLLNSDPYYQLRNVVGNLGNAYISYAVAKLLGLTDANTIWNQSIWHSDHVQLGTLEDHVNVRRIVLTLQDQIRIDLPDEPFRTGYDVLCQLERIDAPLFVFSLGANLLPGYPSDVAKHLSRDKLRFFHYLAERALTLGVRGEFTANVLADLGITNVEVVGCPSYFENGANRIVPPPGTLSGSELALTGNARLSPPHKPLYLLQGDHDWPLIDLAYMNDAQWHVRDEPLQALATPMSLPIVEAIVDGRAIFCSDLEAWKRRLAGSCRAVFGSRLHAAILALNAGVPAAVSNDDARAQEVCAYFGIPLISPALARHASPQRMIDFCSVEDVNQRYAFCYERFCDWLARYDYPVSEPPVTGYEIPSLQPRPDTTIRMRASIAVRDEIVRLYKTYCMRRPTSEEIRYWSSSVRAGGSFDTMILMMSLPPPPGAKYFHAITNCYLDYFGRPPRVEEVETWEEALNCGATLIEMRVTLLDSPEGLAASDATIGGLYRSSLDRDPTEHEVDVWRRTLRQGGTYADLRRRLLTIEPEGHKHAGEMLSSIYRRFKERDAHEDEIELWLDALQRTGMIEAIVETFLDRLPIEEVNRE